MSGVIDGLESQSLVEGTIGRSYSDMTDTDAVSRPPDKNGSEENVVKGKEELEYVDNEASVLSQFHEDAIQQAGMGAFQHILLLVTGLGLAADTIELFVIAYVIPSAEVELCMSGTKKGWLAAITFVGMMIGAIIWGVMSDRIGRRRALLSALFVNAIFGLLTAFMPTYGIFMTTRLCSGIGVGGGIPIAFAYYCEFVTRNDRGKHLSWLLIFWALGGVFTALMAWVIIPRTGITVVLDEQHHFSSWRIFLVVCSIPSFAAVLGLYFMPESPRFLLENGRDVEAMVVYKKIFKWNNSHSPKAEYQLTELELPTGTHRALGGDHAPQTGHHKGVLESISHNLQKFLKLFMNLFKPQFYQTTVVFLVLWFTCSFGFYGLSVWFPEYIKVLQTEDYESKGTIIRSEVYERTIFNRTHIDNVRYEDVIFNGAVFDKTVFNHVVFKNCSIYDCTFSDVRSSRTFFRDTYLARNLFVDTDMYSYRFENCRLVDNTFRALVPGCQLDFDYNIHYEDVFQENLFGQLTMLPGTLVAALFLDKFGRSRVMTVSLLLSAISAFFIWCLNTKIGVIFFESVFNFIFIAGWNALDIATTEAYPAYMRTTAYGFLSATSRIAGILGSLCFGHFIYVSRAVPMLMTTVVLLIGAYFSLKMTETRDVLM